MNQLKLYRESNKDVDVVSEYVLSLNSREEQAKLLALLEKIDEGGSKYLIETQEYNTRKLEADLFEIKISKNRFMYCYRDGNVVYIVHAFYKSTQKTPKKELELARKRIREVK